MPDFTTVYQHGNSLCIMLVVVFQDEFCYTWNLYASFTMLARKLCEISLIKRLSDYFELKGSSSRPVKCVNGGKSRSRRYTVCTHLLSGRRI